MLLDSSRHFGTCGSEIILEQLEERIVLDGAIDDVSCRADVFSSQAVDQLDSGDFADDAAGAEAGLEAPSLAVETGSETLPDGTWHYWERDEWTTDSNGYEFHAWQDGSTSFHQVQWDAATNSKGTHNGFDYNLQRDGSWTYQAVQWDANQNGYSYDATSTGTFTYEADQWSNGMGYSYASNSNGQWTYHVLEDGDASGDVREFDADSGGYWDFTYTWANGATWNEGSADHPFMVVATDNYPNYLTNCNGTLYYFLPLDTPQLWKTDGTPGGTVKVKDINFGSGSNLPEFVTGVNDTLYFVDKDLGDYGADLWKSDGTEAGTVVLKHFANFGWEMADVNGILYFGADNVASGLELWKSDGTVGGTVLVRDIYPGSAENGIRNDSMPMYLTSLNGTIYFSANDGIHGREPWKSDGTAAGTVMVDDIYEGDFSSSPDQFTSVNGKVYFRAEDNTHGKELWQTTGSWVTMVEDISTPPEGYSSSPVGLTNVNGTLFFAAYESSLGTELWKSTGSGATLVKDINPGSHSGLESGYEDENYFTSSNGLVYFVADDGTNGKELWRSDGTLAGTFMLTGIGGGDESGLPDNLKDVNGTLYFSNSTGYGDELWKSDGTPAGTVRVTDIHPFAGSTSPDQLTLINGTLYFGADYDYYERGIFGIKVASSVTI